MKKIIKVLLPLLFFPVLARGNPAHLYQNNFTTQTDNWIDISEALTGSPTSGTLTAQGASGGYIGITDTAGGTRSFWGYNSGYFWNSTNRVLNFEVAIADTLSNTNTAILLGFGYIGDNPGSYLAGVAAAAMFIYADPVWKCYHTDGEFEYQIQAGDYVSCILWANERNADYYYEIFINGVWYAHGQTYDNRVSGTLVLGIENTAYGLGSTHIGLADIWGEEILPTPTITETVTVTPTDSPTVTPTDTPTDTPTATPTETPTNSPTVTPTATPSITKTDTPTVTPTKTPTPTKTITVTVTPTNTPRIGTGRF